MMHGVFAPVLSSLAIGAALIGVNVVHDATATHAVTHRLALHAPIEKDAFYMTAFDDGDVDVTFHDGQLHPITFRVRASLTDGCRWLGTEQLTPLDAHTFFYDYSEVILDCDADATPARKTPRSGIVSVVD